MTTVSRTQRIHELRQRTGADLPLIRRAVELFPDDLAAAEAHVRDHRKGPKDHSAAAGLIVADTHQGRIGAMVEVRCGTDFVARTDEFRALCRELWLQVVGGPGEGLLEEQDSVRDPRRKVRDLIDDCARKVGETITVRRYARWEL